MPSTAGSPEEWLADEGYECAKVWRVWSAGESGTGYDTFLFTTDAGVPKTAFIRQKELVIIDGWKTFNPIYH